MGWYESQQILSENRTYNNVLDLILGKKTTMQKMIQEEAFKSQLLSAREELNIPEEVMWSSQGRVKAND
jgi:hypothetical protein